MEVVYLLCSIAYAFLTSSFLSVSLAFRSFLLFLFSGDNSRRASKASDDGVRFYEGRVRHVRRKPVHHAFDYPVRYALLNLDRQSTPPPFPLSGYLSADQARSAAATNGPVLLLTIPTSVGYDQNPLSVYYCFNHPNRDSLDHGDEDPVHPSADPAVLANCIAEVTNTPWGERVTFVFSPNSDLVAKPLHVSPFMDMLGTWRIYAAVPGDSLSLTISVQHPTLGNYFLATLTAKRVPSLTSSVSAEIFFWLMPQKVAVWIYWQALRLWWKGVSFVQHPRYSNQAYRQDALLRDRELFCLYRNGENRSHSDPNLENSHPAFVDGENKENRWCVWKEAEWPWA